MRGRLIAAATLALLGAPAAAVAGDVSVVVRDARGAPVADAVVTIDAPGERTPARYGQPLRVSQRNLMFEPAMLVVPVGAEVEFTNEDKVRHHVYSFSKAKTFELKLFGAEKTHAIRFDKAGVVALGCNIHDKMAAYIKVVDAPYADRTDAAGRATIRGVRPGPVTVHVWRPNLRAPGGEVVAKLESPKSGVVEHAFTAPVPPARPTPGM